MKRSLVTAAALVVVCAPLSVAGAGAAGSAPQAGARTTGPVDYVVVYAAGASPAEARAAITAAGGTLVRENSDVGVATVRTRNADFSAAVAQQSALAGSAHDQVIGRAPDDVASEGAHKPDPAALDDATASSSARQGRHRTHRAHHHGGRGGHGHHPRPGRPEPLAALQWDMQQIDATTEGSYRYEQGERGVTVGVIDTGVDGSHPDIAANFDRRLSRNFTVDLPADANGTTIDGPCAEDPDQSCTDPADVDEDGHGTHVASTIASPINDLGMSGVAPRVRIVNLRAGQDSGYFFLQPSVDALTYAGRTGIDVVNMSYYVDPWLFNCTSNPADSAEDQAEQRTVILAMQRALDYARGHGVTLVSAAGNGATDYTKPSVDDSSPDFAAVPGEVPYERPIDPASCTSMPSEGDGVITVSATGPSTRKAYYSDYGNGYVDVAAPGGDVYDTPAGTRDITAAVLAAYPESLARASGAVDANGDPVVTSVVKSCRGATCAYYQYLQGTSMASPHVAGVAALIVSRYGHPDRYRGGLTMDPRAVEAILRRTATETACPDPATYHYRRVLPDGTVAEADATCEGTESDNGFYGSGIVNALAAVGR